ncbi:MAG: YbaB/EbfC family nucleoid-associated protein [Pirellulales bacterium]|nr:YbaB/EbfC family nucleoid-associated protein [Pirellulales bacterium]
MFKGLGNIASLMKQASQMGGKLQGINEELKSQSVTGAAGGGMVEINMSGLSEALSCSIDPSLVKEGDRELLEDLVVAAVNQAVTKSRELHASAMKNLAGGMNLPGLDDALQQMTGGATPSPDDGNDDAEVRQ